VAGVATAGRPGPALIEQARGADLLVLGSHGQGRLFHAVLGSVAAECVHGARCPVVVLPAPQRERVGAAASTAAVRRPGSVL
jgi:nucleotide-binding universal stress UspA family protein